MGGGPSTLKIPSAYLQLVLTGLGLRRRVEEVDRENLFTHHSLALCSHSLSIKFFFFPSRRRYGVMKADGGDDVDGEQEAEVQA